MAIWSSPKNFETVLEQSGTDFQTIIGLMCYFFCVIANKMNNMLVV